tara:strand:- start:255 stop:551 length:297 start_codon:yes stop_codon:yes gene_type:complete
MWDMLERMASDRLWIYTAIAGSVFGAIFVSYMRNTKLGLWFYAKVDLFLDYLIKKWGLSFLEQAEDSWKYKYPMMRHKIDEIEKRLTSLESQNSNKRG